MSDDKTQIEVLSAAVLQAAPTLSWSARAGGGFEAEWRNMSLQLPRFGDAYLANIPLLHSAEIWDCAVNYLVSAVLAAIKGGDS